MEGLLAPFVFVPFLLQTATPTTTDAGDGARAIARLPLAFVENAGQWDESVKFRARRGGMGLDAGEAGFLLRLARVSDDRVDGVNLRFDFEGSARGSSVEGREELPGLHSHFVGEDPSRWRGGLRGFARVGWSSAWPGVDLVVRERGADLEYDLFLASADDLDRVELRVAGASGPLRLDESGALLAPTALGDVRQPRPIAWVGSGGAKAEVAVRFRILGDDRFGFGAEGEVPAGPLVVDPGLVYSTFLGGSGNESAKAVAVGATGQATVVGTTSLGGFPTTPGSYSTTGGGGNDVFVTRLAADGASLVFSTYLGGSGNDTAQDVEVDAFGQATVVGFTTGSFPVTPGAYDTTFGGGADVFVARLSLSGNFLVYATYLGGAGNDSAPSVFVDAAGFATLAGLTTSAAFPTTPNAVDTTQSGGGVTDAFVSCINPTGATLPYSTVLGGGTGEYGGAVSIDSGGVATVVGTSFSPGLATPGAFDTTYNGGADAFVARVPLAGGALLAFTYLGASNMELGWGAAHDGAGMPTVAGFSNGFGTGFPSTSGPFGTGDYTFVARFDPSLASLAFATLVGGASLEIPAFANQRYGFGLDAAGAAYVGGRTAGGVPTQVGGFDPSFNGAPDAFVAKLSPNGTAVEYATYLGDIAGDNANDLAVAPGGGVIVVGDTLNSGFPSTPGAYDTTFNFGLNDAFVARLDLLPDGVFNFGASTPGCNGPLAAGVNSAPQLGNASFAITCANGPPNAPGVLGISGAKFLSGVTVLNLEIWIDFLQPSFFTINAATNGVGFASVPVPVPNDPFLVGFAVFGQFGFLGPNAPAPPCPFTGLVTSNGIEVNPIP